jgi:hypothetical protein
MSDQPDGGSLPELTPEQESHVRRLLAEARHDEPIPPAVADRLETVLAGLGRDEPGAEGVAPVIDLAARRRRRNAAAMLAGAAAVIVAGFAIGQVIDVGNGGDAGGSSASDVTAGDGSSRSASSANPGSSDGSSSVAGSEEVQPQAAAGPVLHLSSKSLQQDLSSQLPQVAADAGSAQRFSSYRAVGCTPPVPRSKFGLGELFPALYDGEPAVVAVRPPADGQQQADVLACGTADQIATATIPSP